MMKGLKDTGVAHTIYTPYNPQSNGLAERMHHTVVNTVGAMFKETNISRRLFREAIIYAAVLHNYNMSSTLKISTSPSRCLVKHQTILSLAYFDALLLSILIEKLENPGP